MFGLKPLGGAYNPILIDVGQTLSLAQSIGVNSFYICTADSSLTLTDVVLGSHVRTISASDTLSFTSSGLLGTQFNVSQNLAFSSSNRVVTDYTTPITNNLTINHTNNIQSIVINAINQTIILSHDNTVGSIKYILQNQNILLNQSILTNYTLNQLVTQNIVFAQTALIFNTAIDVSVEQTISLSSSANIYVYYNNNVSSSLTLSQTNVGTDSYNQTIDFFGELLLNGTYPESITNTAVFTQQVNVLSVYSNNVSSNLVLVQTPPEFALGGSATTTLVLTQDVIGQKVGNTTSPDNISFSQTVGTTSTYNISVNQTFNLTQSAGTLAHSIVNSQTLTFNQYVDCIKIGIATINQSLVFTQSSTYDEGLIIHVAQALGLTQTNSVQNTITYFDLCHNISFEQSTNNAIFETIEHTINFVWTEQPLFEQKLVFTQLVETNMDDIDCSHPSGYSPDKFMVTALPLTQTVGVTSKYNIAVSQTLMLLNSSAWRP